MHLSMSDCTLKTIDQLVEIYFIIDPQKFHFLKFILEGYDNLALLSSFDRRNGVVRVKTSREQYPEMIRVLAEIAEQIKKKSL